MGLPLSTVLSGVGEKIEHQLSVSSDIRGSYRRDGHRS